MLIDLLGSTNEHVQRQAAKALANLGVNGARSCWREAAGCVLMRVAVPCLQWTTRSGSPRRAALNRSSTWPAPARSASPSRPSRRWRIWLSTVRRELCSCGAASDVCLSSCADANEVEIARKGGLKPIIDGATSESVELQSQVARALRNLSVNRTLRRRRWCALVSVANGGSCGVCSGEQAGDRGAWRGGGSAVPRAVHQRPDMPAGHTRAGQPGRQRCRLGQATDVSNAFAALLHQQQASDGSETCAREAAAHVHT